MQEREADMVKLDTSKRKVLFIAVMGISFLAILIYNFLTPLMSDELQFEPEKYQSLWDVVKETYRLYMNWNGRSVVQFLMNCSLFLPKWIFNILNSMVFVLLMLLIYWNIENRKKYDFVLFGLVNLLVWQFGVSFDQTVLWVSGACNYLWGSTIILGFVTYYRYKLQNVDKVKNEVLLAIGLFFFGMAAGWCNENTSGGGFLLVLFSLATFYMTKKKLRPWMITGAGGMLTGLLFMVLAPGNRARGALVKEAEEHQGILALVGRFLKINNAVNEYLLLMLIGVILIVTYMILKRMGVKTYINAAVFAVVSIATAYALIMTAQPMDRAYFGAGIFMITAFVQAVAYIPREDAYLNVLKYGGIVSFTIFMFFSYCENGADLARIMREVNEREEYILEQMSQGNYDLTVPMLRPEFETRYSFMYLNDVSEDPESWGCSILKNYYGLDSLVGVPREDWTEY